MARQVERRSLTAYDILAGHKPAIVSIAERLRRVVREAVPEASEHAYPVWRAIGYRHPKAGYFCGIFPFPDRVSLAFEFGAYLPDPKRVLTPGRTSSKRVRYLELQSAKDVRVGTIRALLDAAIQFRAGPEKAKLRGVRSSRRTRG